MKYDINIFAAPYHTSGDDPLAEIELPDGFNDEYLTVEAENLEQARQRARSQIAEKYLALGCKVVMSMNNESVWVENGGETGVEFYGFDED